MNTAIHEYSAEPVETTLLGHLPFFKGANLAALEPVLTQCPVLKLEEGDVLIDQGQPMPVAYQVLSGSLSSYAPDGSMLAAIKPGDYIGAIESIANARAQSQIRANSSSTLLVLDEGGLMGMVNCSHTVARNTLFVLMEHVRIHDMSAAANDDFKPEKKSRYGNNSHIDEFTGLYDRAWMKDMLSRQILRSATESKPLTVLMLCIDEYENFVADYGQDAANHAQNSIAEIIRNNARPTDLYSLMGENEFVLALPDTDIDGGTAAAERLRSVTAESQVVIPGECMLPPVTMSVGLVQMRAFVADEQLLTNAREAMNKALSAGGNRVEIQDSSIQT